MNLYHAVAWRLRAKTWTLQVFKILDSRIQQRLIEDVLGLKKALGEL